MATQTIAAQERIALPAPVYHAGGEGGTAPTPGEFLAMLRRRMVLILVLSTLFSGMAVGGFVVWAKYFPGYQSHALIECISNIPEADQTVEQRQLKQDEHARFVMTQAMRLKSPTLLAGVLKTTVVRETSWFKALPPNEALLELTAQLRAAPVRGTNFLRASMQCRDPRDPAVIVNEVVSQWFHTTTKQAAEEFADDPLDAAQQEMETLDREIKDLNDRLQGIVDRLPAGATGISGQSTLHDQVRQLSESKALYEMEKVQLEQFKEYYENPGFAVTPEDRMMVEQDPTVARLSQQSLELEQRRSAAMEVYGTAHKVLQQLDAQIFATEKKLSSLRLEKLQERRADMREASRTAYDNALHSLFSLREKLLEAEAHLQDQDRLLFEYDNVRNELNRKEEKRIQRSEYIDQLMRIKTRRSAIRVNIAQRAIDPLRRSSPNVLLLPVGIFLALALSGGIAIGLELMDKSVRTSQDVIRHLNVPLLGLVPHTDDEEVDIEQVETAVRDVPQSMVAEVFRRIRTNLQFSASAAQQRTLLITSPTPEDGKTTIACNLAIAMAQAGRRVLLVDANFRRPGVSLVFSDGKGQGLSNLLIGDGDLSSYAVHTDIPALDILETGPTPANPVELLGTVQCRAFLDEAMSQYDQVIVDAAPVLLASDAVVLGTVVDGVILVIRANRNSRGIARRACNLLMDVDAHLYGAVLNAAQVTRGGYFREQLRAHYDYQHQTADIDSAPRLEPEKAEAGSPGE